jgi:hypothetical protein
VGGLSHLHANCTPLDNDKTTNSSDEEDITKYRPIPEKLKAIQILT